MEEIHVNNVGVRLQATIMEDGAAVDISSASTKEIHIRKADGTLLEYAATFLTDGTDGIIYYDTILGDLDTVGTYKIQAKIITAAGTFYSEVSDFRVYCNI